MAKNANNPQVKGRQTKLSKKSSEELIEIILRKDDTERKLTSQLNSLKTEVSTKEEDAKVFESKFKNIKKNYDALKVDFDVEKDIRINQEVTIEELKEKVKIYSATALFVSAVAVVMIIALLIINLT